MSHEFTDKERQTIEVLSEQRIPIRLAVVRSNGVPLIASLWFLWHGDRIWCAMHESAALAKILHRNQDCGFELSPNAPPYFGIRGGARAHLHRNLGEETLVNLIDHYLPSRRNSLAEWLLSRADGELAVELEVTSTFSWDYRSRMASALNSSSAER